MSSVPRTCDIDNCENKHQARGWCNVHYQVWRRYGDPNYAVPPRNYDGRSKHPLYNTWIAMRERTLKPQSYAYKWYGGRGITVCNRWAESFNDFLEDMGERPDKMSLDRIDNDGHYSCGKCVQCFENNWPMNVRWATKNQQSINRRGPNTNTTGYVGVSYYHKWYHADIMVKGVDMQLGKFKTAKEAALAYNIAALQYRGPDAKLNVL